MFPHATDACQYENSNGNSMKHIPFPSALSHSFLLTFLKPRWLFKPHNVGIPWGSVLGLLVYSLYTHKILSISVELVPSS